MDEDQWSQAKLRVKFGGFGIRKIEDVALPAVISWNIHSILINFPGLTDVVVEEDGVVQVWRE
jgi:hypothetical protein